MTRAHVPAASFWISLALVAGMIAVVLSITMKG